MVEEIPFISDDQFSTILHSNPPGPHGQIRLLPTPQGFSTIHWSSFSLPPNPDLPWTWNWGMGWLGHVWILLWSHPRIKNSEVINFIPNIIILSIIHSTLRMGIAELRSGMTLMTWILIVLLGFPGVLVKLLSFLLEVAGSSIHSDCSPHTDTPPALRGGLRPRVNMPTNGKSPQSFSALVPGQPDRSFKVRRRNLFFPTFSFFHFFVDKF